MAIKPGKVELRILADRILVKATSPDEKPGVFSVTPREGKTLMDALQSIIRSLDNLPPPHVVEAMQIIFDNPMAPEVLKSLKKVCPELKSQNFKKLIVAIINYLEKFLSGQNFDPRRN